MCVIGERPGRAGLTTKFVNQVFEIVDILKAAVHTGKAHIRHFVEFFQFAHDQFTNAIAGKLSQAKAHEPILDTQQACIDLFGARRCMFASNFPIDLLYGKTEDLFTVFEAIAKSRTEAEAADLFAGAEPMLRRVEGLHGLPDARLHVTALNVGKGSAHVVSFPDLPEPEIA